MNKTLIINEEYLKEHGYNYTVTENGAITVEGNFDCSCNDLTELKIPDNFTVGGCFNCSGNNLTKLVIPDSLTVAGDFYCSGNNLTKLVIPDSLTVAGYFDCSYNKLTEIPQIKTEQKNIILSWQNGKYRKIDGIFCEVLKECKNVLKVKTRNKDAYVFEKDGISAHGKTVKQAYYDWLFKTSDRDVEEYREINLNDVKPLDYWVIAYRQITGACSFGTNEFLEHNKEKYKSKMTLAEVITATKGQYGSETFKEFFREVSSV